jgi:hypothetical protein
VTKIPPPVLFATRDPEPGADIRHAADHRHGLHGLHEVPRSGSQRFTGAVQLIGSIIGIPLALASGYSIYRANFSPESACQSLRAGIVSMLDKNADASTLRMLVHRDVVSFENQCGAYDPDAVAAFRNLLATERTPARHIGTRPAVEAVVAKPPAKAETPARIEPAKREALAKPDAKMETKPETKPEAKAETKSAIKPEAVVRREPKAVAPAAAKREHEPAAKEVRRELRLEPKQDGKRDLKALEDAKAILEPKPVAPAMPSVATPAVPQPADLTPADIKPADATIPAAKAPEAKAEGAKPVATKPAELKPPEAVPAAPQPAQASLESDDTTQVDAAWVARVREALRESSQRPQPADVDAPPAAASPAQAAAPMPPPIVVPDQPAAENAAPAASTPPDHPVPPEPIPNVGSPPAGN